MTRRIRTLVALAIAALFLPLSADAQQPGKIPRIGVLASIRYPATEGFERGLKELGYIEGKNIIIEWRLVQGKFDRLPEFVADLVRLKVDVIVAPANPYVRAAKNATSTTPIVFVLVADPVGAGFVASLARPGGNITGLLNIMLELTAKRLELLKEAVPKVSRVGVLTNPAGAGFPVAEVLKGLEVAARALSLQLQVQYAREPSEIDGAFATMSRQGASAVMVVSGSPMFHAERARIATLALKAGLPTMSEFAESVVAGGLVSYTANPPDLMRRSAYYVDKILKGTKPADLPVEQPTKFELVINLKTAKAIGLTIPQSFLLRADEIIQ
ncbi:MAG: ABC transporter substrate-binding protein [Candidatus Rokuibacteriota bacterium]